MIRIAIPTVNGALAEHFDHCAEFAIIDVDENRKELVRTEMVPPPVHQPGMLPGWLGQQGVTVVIAGGLGSRAIQIFEQMGIRVLPGAPVMAAEALVTQYLAGQLKTQYTPCDHSGGHGCGEDDPH